MSKAHDASVQTGIDMGKARTKTSIDVSSVRHFVYNGREEWDRKEKLVDVMSRDPVFNKAGRQYMNRTEKYTRGMRMVNHVYELEQSLGWSKQDTTIATGLLDEALPISLHNTAFAPVLTAQSSPDLLRKYSSLVATRGVLGCYLQTELGHGSNVASLETTATFIPETQEFDIHSPTLTSSKWWIGALGKTATHGVVQAKLILPSGKDMGPHLFLVQLRSLDDHKLLPGITAGDIGPKAFGGFAPTDNGFARFDHVRIPKENMLSKFAQVTDDGKYIQPPHAKISYGGMLYIRAGMITTSGWLIAKAAVVSIRYATVRRQGNKGPDGLESQVISYPSVHARLLPILSRAYVFIELGRSMTRSFDAMSERLVKGDTSLLAELHATTSGLKVLATSTCVADLESARRSMGGHGYSAFTGVAHSYADYVPSVTFEGENFVLDQQAVRAALKAFRNIFRSSSSPSSSSSIIQNLPPSTYYLRLLLSPKNEPPMLTENSWRDHATAILLLEWRAALLVHEIAQTSGEPDATIHQRVSKAVTEAFVASQVGVMLKSLSSSGLRAYDDDVVRKLYLLYLLTTIEAALTDFLSFGLLRMTAPSGKVSSRDPTRTLRMTIAKLCLELLPEAIGLTDALGLSDWELDSVLGVYNGKVYQALWERAQTEPLNQSEVPAAYEESIKPILQRGQSLARKDGAKL